MSNKPSVVTKLVLDVLKPLDPSIVVMASELAEIEGISSVNIMSVEIDRNTESVKVSVEGNDIDIGRVKKVIEELGGVIHSIDEVISVKSAKSG